MSSPLVSIVIPTYNNFEGLLLSLESIKNQSFTDYEVIVIDDGSSDKRYKEWKFDQKVNVINRTINSVQKKGYFSDSIRNDGIENSSGKYIAFLDDDDYWFPEKLGLQIQKLESSKFKMTSSEAVSYMGLYDEQKPSKLYNNEIVFNEISNIYKKSKLNKEFRKNFLFKFKYPSIWTSRFISIHNCIITSSVVVEKKLLEKVGNFRDLQNDKRYSDWDCWLGLLTHTDLYYFSEPLLFYSLSDGQNKRPQ